MAKNKETPCSEEIGRRVLVFTFKDRNHLRWRDDKISNRIVTLVAGYKISVVISLCQSDFVKNQVVRVGKIFVRLFRSDFHAVNLESLQNNLNSRGVEMKFVAIKIFWTEARKE